MWFFTLLLKNLFRRKVRSALTCSGVALAVGTMVTLLGISDGFERAFRAAFESRGVDIVVTQADLPQPLDSDLDEAIAQRIEQLDGVVKVGPGLLELINFTKDNTVIGALVQGWKADSLFFRDLEIIAPGRGFTQADRRVALVGVTLAKNLNKQVGDILNIAREPFTVVGIFQSFNHYENGSVIVPLAELQNVSLRKNRVTGFSIILSAEARSKEDVERVKNQIHDLRDASGKPLGLSAQPTQDYVANSMPIQLAHAMAWLTSVVAVLIGSIGMLNTMIMSVYERIREIGILRAIGWRQSRVVRMILGEALLLSLAGAVLGTGTALVLTRWLTTFPQVAGFIQGEIAVPIIMQGFLLALGVGVLGGLYPAFRAARLLPTEALRHE